MAVLDPLDDLFDRPGGSTLPLPESVARLYGRLSFPPGGDKTNVIANFVQSIDGVVALDDPDFAGGSPISGGNPHDRFVMALLRAVSVAVMVGAGTLRSVPRHLWIPEHVAPDFSDDWAALRRTLGLSPHPLNVILTASGRLEGDFRVLRQDQVPVLIVTTRAGAERLASSTFPARIRVVAASDGSEVSPAQALGAIVAAAGSGTVLLEGGPSVMGDFFGVNLVDELFLTLAPQVAGRASGSDRPGFVSGRLLAPVDPRWASLVSLKRAADMLFLRYRFSAGVPASVPPSE